MFAEKYFSIVKLYDLCIHSFDKLLFSTTPVVGIVLGAADTEMNNTNALTWSLHSSEQDTKCISLNYVI